MSISVNSVITFVSLASLIHCAYSAAQHRFYLRLIEKPFEGLPIDVIVQTLVSLVTFIYGASNLAVPFQLVKKDQHPERTSDEVLNCPSFITFEHRRKALSPEFYLFSSDAAAATVYGESCRQNDSQYSSPNFNNLPGARLPKSSSKSKVRVLEITKKQADEAFQNCFQLVKQHDVDSYLSILASKRRVQPELVVLNAFNVELAKIRDKVDTRKGDTSAMYRLQFWKDALNSIYGVSNLPVPRQPIAIGLCVFAPSANHELLSKLVETRQSTIGDKPFPTTSQLCSYGKTTTGALLSLQVDAFARASNIPVVSETYTVCEQIGASAAIVNLIRSTLPLLTRGVVLLPTDVMQLHSITPDSVFKKKKPDETRAFVSDLVKEAKLHLENAKSASALIPKQVLPALAGTVATTEHILKTIEKCKYDIYSPYLQRRNPLHLWSVLSRRIIGKL